MNSERHTLVVPFQGGLDTKSDRMTVQQGKLLELENGVFTKHNIVAKRKGYDGIPFEDVDGVACVGDPNSLHAVRNELVLSTTEKLYSYSEKNNAWAEVGGFSPITTTQTEVLGSNTEPGYAEVATANGVTVYVWEESNAIYATCTDDNTGAVYFNRHELEATTGIRPRVVAIGGTLQVFWVDTSTDDIYTWTVRSWEPQVATDTAGTAIITDFETTNNRYDVVEATEDYCLLAWINTTPDVRLVQVAPGGSTLLATDVATSATVLSTSEVSLAYYGGKAYVFWVQSISQYRRYRVNVSDMVVDISSAAVTLASIDNVTVAANSTGVLAVFEDTGATNDVSIVKSVAATSDFSDTPYWSGLSGFVRHAYLATSPFVIDDVIYVLVGHDSRSGLQDGYYLYNQSGVLCGQLMFGEGAGVFDTASFIPRVRSTAAGAQVPLHYKRFADAADDNIDVREHIGLRHMTFSHQKVEGSEAEGVLYIGGSQIWAYDGVQCTEAALSMFPDVLDADFSETGSGSLADGTYTFRFYYEGRNALGQRIRSGAITKTYEISGGGGTETLEITVPTLSFTEWDDLVVVGYVTEVDKTDFYYRFTSNDPASWTNNSKTANSVTLTYDDETGLTSNEIDPFAFEEPTETTNPGPYLATSANRLLYGGGAVRENEVSYSKLQFPGENVRFTQTFTTEAAPRAGGAVKGISNLDNTPIVFKERAIYGVAGEGPDNSLLSGYYTPELITSDTGMRDSGTAAVIPNGILFVSQKGIYLLDRSLQVQYLGARAEAFNTYNFVSAEVIPDTNLVVFLTSDGPAVVYDYFYDEWSTWTNHKGLDAAIRAGTQYCYLRTDGKVYRQNNEYTDAGSTYKLRARTAPVRLNSIQGYYQVRRYQVVGNYKSAHTLRVKLYYNRDTAPRETYVWDPSTVINIQYWGDQATWGADSVWGGSAGGSDYHHEHRPQHKRAQSLGFEFEEIPGSPAGAGFELIEIAIEAVVWDGLARIPTSRKY